MILPFETETEVRAAAAPVRAQLEADRLIAYPTETVYGLGSAPRDSALTPLSQLKGRPARKPFLLLVSGRLMAEEWGLVFPPAARAMADYFWPGPLTLVLRGGEGRLPDRLRGPEGGIAVRHTSHAGMALLVRLVGFPITSTSANRPGGPPAPGVDRLEVLFRDAVNDGLLLVLDGGVLGNVPPSTIVDCTGPVPVLIREGALPRPELRRAVGRHAP
jgi:L-threonylcarbamoyladenylate synthase